MDSVRKESRTPTYSAATHADERPTEARAALRSARPGSAPRVQPSPPKRALQPRVHGARPKSASFARALRSGRAAHNSEGGRDARTPLGARSAPTAEPLPLPLGLTSPLSPGGKGARQGRFSGLAGSPRLARSPGAARPLPCRCSRVPPRIVEAPRNRRGSPGCFSRSPARGRFRFARFRVRRPLAARGSACSGRCRCRCRCNCFRPVVLSFSRGDFLSVESLIPFFAAAPLTPKSMVRLDYGARFGARFCCLRSEAVRSRGLFARSDRRGADRLNGAHH